MYSADLRDAVHAPVAKNSEGYSPSNIGAILSAYSRLGYVGGETQAVCASLVKKLCKQRTHLTPATLQHLLTFAVRHEDCIESIGGAPSTATPTEDAQSAQPSLTFRHAIFPTDYQ